MVRLDKKTIELLESRNLELKDFTARICVELNGYSDDENNHTTFEVTYHEEAEEKEQIGSATFLMFDSTKMSAAYIREHTNNLEFCLYQAVSSVRIYPTKADSKFDQMQGFKKDYENTDILLYKDYLIEKGLPLPLPFIEEFQDGVFEAKPYNDLTISVYGRILVLQDWELKKKYKTNAIINELFKSMMKGFYSLGQDWIIFNTNIDEEYMKKAGYFYHTQKSYDNFLEKQGFQKSYGRLRNDNYCYCYHIQNSLDKPTFSFFSK